MVMRQSALNTSRDRPFQLDGPVALIAGIQRPNGEIPWHDGGKTDPWDHVEAAMGLAIGGRIEAAAKAYRWLAAMQRHDGSWYAGYRHSRPEDRTRETNLSAYIAVGVLHHYLTTGDIRFVESMWPTLRSAIAFAISLQTPHGDIYWAYSPRGAVDPMALLTGCSSIFMSLKCALAIAKLLGERQPVWQRALNRLGYAIRHKSHRFNMTKSRFSMDWFYPVLAGAVTGPQARERIAAGWKKFVVDGYGVKCVSDEPWVTLAETAELVLSLKAMGDDMLAHIVFNWIYERRYEDGSYWCGFTVPEVVVWPEHKMSWTNAVVLMAADALFRLTPAAILFSHRFWDSVYSDAPLHIDRQDLRAFSQ